MALATSPNTTRLTIHNVYAAPSTSVIAAANATSGWCWKLARMTMNSPTNPDVPGRPAFAMAKNTKKAPNQGITFTTPP